MSTVERNLDLQRDALRRAGCSGVYEEHASGAKATRPERTHAPRAQRAGDTLVVWRPDLWRLDRLGCARADSVRIVTELRARGAAFESLTERVDPTTAAGSLVFHVFASLAEFERELLRERALGPKKLREITALLRDPEAQVVDVARRYDVSRSTLYNYRGAVRRTAARADAAAPV